MFDKSGLLECTGLPYEFMLPRIFVTPKNPDEELPGSSHPAGRNKVSGFLSDFRRRCERLTMKAMD